MTRFGFCVLLASVTAAPGAQGAEKVRESATFANILGRVMDRDEDSGAILSVKMKEDAPQCCGGRLEFQMYERLTGPNEWSVIITLRTPTVDGNVYEQYTLVADDAIKAELRKLELMKKQKAEKAKKVAAELTDKIKKATDGKLKYGMTREEVVAVLGEPKSVNDGFMEGGRFSLEYEHYRLEFRITLFDLEETK